MTTLTLNLPLQTASRDAGAWAAAVHLLTLWYARARQRSQLAALSDRQLADIGVTREQADREAAKPFWRS
ncbi:MAG: DUF1127 domain-containing protein [Chromatiaceae bacterium]|nr:DUF1127 domain-containing protein [Gammaproteobacteria bacterium]MCP5298234.1 DUF1127 domain-containing protein [Chromatiaceae bacterium]MCP5423226.1 DUF1127 domain-containing protein [Chromatiaceae bacterium]